MIDENADLATLSDDDLDTLILQLRSQAEHLKAFRDSKSAEDGLPAMQMVLLANQDISGVFQRISAVHFEQHQRMAR